MDTQTDWYDRIELLGRIISRDQMESDPQSVNALLKEAKLKEAIPNCLCRGKDNKIPMYIAKQGEKGYTIKRCPNTGDKHHAECDSHGGISASAKLIYTRQAIIERPDGKVLHNLAVPLSTIEQVSGITLDEAAAPPRPDRPQAKRNTMTLRGFLNLLWEEAGLHTWSPGMAGKRNLGRVYWALRSQLADRLIGTEQADLRIYIPQAKVDPENDRRTECDLKAHFEHFQTLYDDKQKGILIVIAELREFQHTARDTLLRLKGFPNNLPIWTPKQSIARLQNQFTHGLSHFERNKTPGHAPWEPDQPPRTIIIAGIQRSRDGNLKWCYGAAMETTGNFIPVDSGYEFKVANMLVNQQRRFEKPLRYDGVAATFPDFVLTDCQTPTPMEVYGMDTPEYNQRKLEKIDIYKKSGKPYWSWDVFTQPEPPTFPQKGL